MNYISIIVIIIIILGIYYFWFAPNVIQESFTSADLDLAKKIMAYLQTSPNNYTGYVNLLIANNNTSTNLITQDTYNALSKQINTLTIADILAKF